MYHLSLSLLLGEVGAVGNVKKDQRFWLPSSPVCLICFKFVVYLYIKLPQL